MLRTSVGRWESQGGVLTAYKDGFFENTTFELQIR